jgi:hypothetical protein
MPASRRTSVDAKSGSFAAGAGKVFREVASGAWTDRPQLRRLLSEVADGDVVMVTRLDRLARSTRRRLALLTYPVPGDVARGRIVWLIVFAARLGSHPHSSLGTAVTLRLNP